MALMDQFWDRVHATIRASPGGRKGVQRALESIRPRNKNTYTSWLSPNQGVSRPDIRLSDVEDIAAALRVPAGVLLFGDDNANSGNGTGTPERHVQLQLPFGQESKTVTLQLECTDAGLIVRPGKD